MDNQDKYVFISYAHKDAEEVNKLIVALEHIACKVWFDSGIEKGTQWSEDLAKHLLGSECVLWFVSKASVESKYVMGEINFSVTHDKQIIPVYIEDVQIPLGVELLLGQIQSVFLYNFEKYSEKRNELMKALPKSVFHEKKSPFFASGSNIFFMNDTSVVFPPNTYFEDERDCSYSVGYSKTGNADDQIVLFGWRAAPGYDMEAKITSVNMIRDEYLKNLDDRVVVFNISLIFCSKYPVPWPDIDAALTVAIYDSDTETPRYKLFGANVLTAVGGRNDSEEKVYKFAGNTIDEIVKQIEK